MQTYDLIIAAILLATTLYGAYKGLAWQVASIGAVFLSYFASYSFRNEVGSLISAAPPWNMFSGMLTVYLSSSAGIWLVFQLVSSFINRLKLKEFDRQVGALLGFAKGVLLCVVVTLFAVALSTDAQRRAIVDSKSGYCIALLLQKSHDVMPPELNDVLNPYLNPLEAGLRNPQSAPTIPAPGQLAWPGQGAAPGNTGDWQYPAANYPSPDNRYFDRPPPTTYSNQPPQRTPREHIAQPSWPAPPR